MSLSSAGLLGAITITVAATTVDDAVWLVPFVGSPSYDYSARVTHAILFALTLECLAVGSVVIALVISSGVGYGGASAESQEVLLGAIGAVLCWVLAVFFFVKKWLKKRRRRQQQQQQSRLEENAALVNNNNKISENDPENYQSTNDDSNDNNNKENGTCETIKKPLTWGTVGTVVSLTFLGALDEVSYFPALIIGNIFTPLEVCLGTLFAAILILILVTCFLARCQRLVDCLDRIPIYAVIALFATILTVGVVYDLLQ